MCDAMENNMCVTEAVNLFLGVFGHLGIIGPFKSMSRVLYGFLRTVQDRFLTALADSDRKMVTAQAFRRHFNVQKRPLLGLLLG